MENRLHNNLVTAVIDTITEIFEDHRYADKAIEYRLKSNKMWGARDRAFIAENSYEIVRWWRMLLGLSDQEGKTRIDFWKIFACWWLYKGNILPPWREFEDLNISSIENKYRRLSESFVYRASIPDWLDNMGNTQLGTQWRTEMVSLNEQAPVVLRVNTLKTTLGKLQKALYHGDIKTMSLKEYPDALVLEERQNVFQSPYFKEGLFEVQDANSQLVAYHLDVKPGMRVVDACAGGGGKTLHMAALMQNKGRIIALDTEQWKLNNLSQRAARAGVSIIENRLIESTKTIKRIYESADRLLLDVPCSGLGVLKRNPDAKWKLTEEFVKDVQVTQQTILESYSKIIKVEGILVYATCSIMPCENQEQVEKFLEKNKNYELMEEKSMLPSESGFDGFYMAKIKRIG